MRPIATFLAGALSAAILGGVALFAIGYTQYTKPGPLQEDVIIAVPRGAGADRVALLLKEEGVIAHPFLFRTILRLRGTDQSIKAGEYKIPSALTMEKILQKLEAGDVHLRSLTIPEGLTSYEIGRLMRRAPALDYDLEAVPEEGSLLPETYMYPAGQKASAITTRMRRAMDEILERLWPGRADDLPLSTPAEAVVLASIVEKETAHSGERAKVAGVFMNRLRQGMKLQSDPTVIYAITKGRHEDEGHGPLGRRLLRKDLGYDSPYNTYRYTGLPPGPIANPGAKAIEATLNPENHDYFYFVADGTGGHAFAKTLSGHNKNVAKWRRIRKSLEKGSDHKPD